jgi:uncharacterized protein involved in exopolysaccharide biosynthesis
VLLSILEAFFRRPLLYLLPLIVMMLLGVYSGFNSPKLYRSVGTLDSSSGEVLSDIASANRGIGFESAAASTSRNLNQRLRTGEFINKVIDEAGLRTAVTQNLLTTDEIRASISAYAEGDNLLAVAATTSDREQSRRLAAATIDEYLDYVIENDNADRLLAIDINRQELASAQSEMDAANEAYETYMMDHQIADEDDRPFVQRLEIRRLERDVEIASADFQDAQARLRDAEFEASQAETVIKRQLRPVDPPETPVAPQARLRKAVLTVAMFTVLGAVMSLVFLVLSAFLDRTIRESDDITDRFGLDVIAVIPAVRRRRR